MTDPIHLPSIPTRVPDGELSLIEIGSLVVRNRWRLLRWMLIGGVLISIPSLSQGPTYTANASFIAQEGQEGAQSGLRSVAGQFGLQLGGGSARSPEFYADLIKSRSILTPIVMSSFTVKEQGTGAHSLPDLFEIKDPLPARRLEKAIDALGGRISTTINQKTGIIRLSVKSPWASLSYEIANSLLSGLNTFNLRTRKSQASAERRFTETQLQDARIGLRMAEDNLQSFLQGNRQWQNSAELTFGHDRLEREVRLQQTLVSGLAESYQSSRIREVRDTPVITVIEPPVIPFQQDRRGRLLRALMGMILGAIVGLGSAIASHALQRRRAMSDPDAEQLYSALGDLRESISQFTPGRRLKVNKRSAASS